MAEEELLTSAKIADRLGVSAAKVSKVIKQLGIQPAQLKGRCGYYDSEAVRTIEQVVKTS